MILGFYKRELIASLLAFLLLLLGILSGHAASNHAQGTITFVNTSSAWYYGDGGSSCPQGQVSCPQGNSSITVNVDVPPNGTFTWTYDLGAVNYYTYPDGNTVDIYAGTVGNLFHVGSWQFHQNPDVPASINKIFYVSGTNCSITDTKPPTNYCMTVVNNTSQTVTAYWQVWQANSSSVDGLLNTYLLNDTQSLAPGQSATRCVSVPSTGNYNSSYGYTSNGSIPDPLNSTNVWTGSTTTSTTNTFSNGDSGGSGSTTTSPSSTDGGTAAGGIIWQNPGSTAATDSTLKQVGGVLHDDNGKLLDALHIIDNHIVDAKDGIIQAITQEGVSNKITVLVTNTGSSDIAPYLTNFFVAISSLTNQVPNYPTNVFVSNFPEAFVTNALGDIEVYTRSNNDALWQLARVFTNTFGTNSISNSVVVNVTNSISPTNNFSITNYATESTLSGISNLLSGVLTNLPDSNSVYQAVTSQQSQGDQNAQQGKTSLEGISQGLSEPDSGETYGSPTTDWQVSVPYLGGHTINLNPFHYDWVVAIASFFRNLVAWVCAVSLVIWNSKLLIDTIQKMFTYRQARTAGSSIFGNNVNTLSCIIVAVAITAVTLIVPLYFANWYGAKGVISMVMSHPFHGSHPSTVQTAVYITDQFFPLAFMVWCLVVRLIFMLSLAPLLWLVGVTIRFLVGL
jgi:hypothetical protein